MRLFAGAIVAMLAACIQDPTVSCGDHRCPTGTVCTTTSCATPDAVAACNSKLDHDGCTTSTIMTGACGEGACHAITCGDQITDPPEACDDGNLIPGDHCSATCDSTEVCGNGVVDAIAGEACDEGVNLSQDGCSSRCKVETPAWRDVTPTAIRPTEGHAMAYDSARHIVVVFGGFNTTTLLGETWEYDGVFWTRRDPPRSPPARAFPAMTYDAQRGVVVMFGGLAGTGHLADTWTWDGVTWTQLVGPSPPARLRGALAYDEMTETTILFGGADADTEFADTWQWNGTWTELHPATSPTARDGHGLAYDSARKTVQLVGGGDSVSDAPQTFRDMWEWNGTTWLDRNVATGPPLMGGSLVYDPATAQLIWFGGFDFQNTYDTMWIWNGSWSSSTPASPSSRIYSTMVWDSYRGCAGMFGGKDNGGVLAETWSLCNGVWQPVPAFLQGPTPRYAAAPVWDSRRDRAIFVGGVTDSSYYVDVWTWRDHVWSPLLSTPSIVLPGLAYDSDRDRVVLFGGANASAAQINETWELAGNSWTKRAPVTSPPIRTAPCLAYDRARRRTVLFGGTGELGPLGDTWEWDGTNWTQATPAVSPRARGLASMAYDEARKRVVLFGGKDDALRLGDTWEWDGVQWTEMHPASSPPARENASIAYDANRGRVVVFGGDATLFFDDVWEWDGTNWTQRIVQTGPNIRTAASMMYDSRRRELVVFGGSGITSFQADVWTLRYSDLGTPDEACVDGAADDDGDGLIGCADPDCWGRCTPTCPPETSCATDEPRCGDGTCSLVEDHKICPQDCP